MITKLIKILGINDEGRRELLNIIVKEKTRVCLALCVKYQISIY